MRYSLALFSLALAGVANAQVTAQITPTGAAPAGCTADASGTYNLLPVKPSGSGKRGLIKKRDTLTITLHGGVLKDEHNTVGYIAANNQFQFDPPSQSTVGAQAGAIYTAGWTLCSNGSLALGPSAVFWECTSGNIKNLYNKNIDKTNSGQCDAIALNLVPVNGASSGSSGSSGSAGASGAGGQSDGQVTATSAAGQKTDGQPTVTSAVTASSAAGQRTDGQVTVSSAASFVSQISDGQNQAPTSAAGQRTDGQITVASSAAGQKTDGQVTIATATATGAAGQQTDGQITASSALPVFTGAANAYHVGAEFAAAVAGVAAVIML